MKKTKEKKNMEIFQQKTNCFLYIFNFHSVIFPSFVFSSQCTHRATTGTGRSCCWGSGKLLASSKLPFSGCCYFQDFFFFSHFQTKIMYFSSLRLGAGNSRSVATNNKTSLCLLPKRRRYCIVHQVLANSGTYIGMTM